MNDISPTDKTFLILLGIIVVGYIADKFIEYLRYKDSLRVAKMIRKIINRLTFIPWYLIKTKIFHKQSNLERLYKYGYCSKSQYKFLKKVGC